MFAARERAGAAVALAGAIAAMWAAAPQTLAAQWLPAVTLPTAALDASAPAVAVSPDGHAVLAWTAALGGGKFATQVAVRAPGAPWSSVTTLPAGGTAAVGRPAVAVNDRGDGVVAWDQGLQVAYSILRPGGAFSVPTLEPNVPSVNTTTQPVVGLDASGAATIVWVERTDSSMCPSGCHSYLLSRTVLGDGTPLPVVVPYRFVPNLPACTTFQPKDLAHDPSLAENPRGDAALAWGLGTGVVVLRRALGAQWPDDVNCSSSHAWASVAAGADEPAVAIDRTGRYVLAVRTLPGVQSGVSMASGSVAGGTGAFAAALPVTPTTASGEPAVGIDGTGTGTAVFQTLDTVGANRRVFANTIDVAGALGATSGGPPLSGTNPETTPPWMDPHLAVAPNQTAIAVWRIPDPGGSGHDVVQAATRPPGGGFSAPQGISDAGQESGQPRVAVDDAGDGLAVFQHFDGSRFLIQAADFTTLPTPPTPPTPSSPGATLAAVSRVSMSTRRFRVGTAPTALAAARARRAPSGTRFRFTLSSAADVTIAIDRARAGRRSGSRCAAPTRRNRSARKCVRYLTAGRLLRRGRRAGANAVPFSGRIGRRALAPGSYRATLTAATTAGTGAPARVTFTVVHG